MRLTVLGSSGTYPSPSNPGSGYLVESGDTSIWLDAGPGTFARLMGITDVDTLDGIVLSHAHPDHCTDIFSALHYFRHGPRSRGAIPLVVPDGLLRRLTGFLGGSEAFLDTFAADVVGAGSSAQIGRLGLSFTVTNHPVPTLATRLDFEGRSIVYTADTGWSDEVVTLADGADVLVCEAALQGPAAGKPYTHHLTAEEAGQIAHQAGVRRLVLTHIPPHLDHGRSVAEAESTFGREVMLAVPGASFST